MRRSSAERSLSPRFSRRLREAAFPAYLETNSAEMSQMTDILTNAVGEFRDVYVTGGGARSALGLQLRAALSGRELHVMKCPEAVCLGGAILAGVACGEYGSLREAVELVVHDVSTVSPDPALAAAYAQQAKQYRHLRSALTAGATTESAIGRQEEQ